MLNVPTSSGPRDSQEVLPIHSTPDLSELASLGNVRRLILMGCSADDPWNTDDPQKMRKCGRHAWCCHSKKSDTNCCDGDQVFELESPTETEAPKVIEKVAQAPLLSTNQSLPILTIKQTLSTSTLERPSSKAPSIVKSSTSSVQQNTLFMTRISSTQELRGSFTPSTALQSYATHSSSSPPSTPATVALSTPQATSTTTPTSPQTEPRTALALTVVLCAVVVLAAVGLIVWFVRSHRRRPIRERKLVISAPIPQEPIPMFEVANTDWEMPVNRDMPSELSANGQTPQILL